MAGDPGGKNARSEKSSPAEAKKVKGGDSATPRLRGSKGGPIMAGWDLKANPKF
jgi:hypothetical protein